MYIGKINRKVKDLRFEEFVYKRPNLEEIEKNVSILLNKFDQAESAEEQNKVKKK
jgi:TATA-binding protein-associated factor Taf7